MSAYHHLPDFIDTIQLWSSAVLNHAHQYTGIHGVFQDIHGSREPGCDKCGVNDTDIGTIIPREGAIVMTNAGLAQVRPKMCCMGNLSGVGMD